MPRYPMLEGKALGVVEYSNRRDVAFHDMENPDAWIKSDVVVVVGTGE